jgi:hypothetical protein
MRDITYTTSREISIIWTHTSQRQIKTKAVYKDHRSLGKDDQVDAIGNVKERMAVNYQSGQGGSERSVPTTGELCLSRLFEAHGGVEYSHATQ